MIVTYEVAFRQNTAIWQWRCLVHVVVARQVHDMRTRVAILILSATGMAEPVQNTTHKCDMQQDKLLHIFEPEYPARATYYENLEEPEFMNHDHRDGIL